MPILIVNGSVIVNASVGSPVEVIATGIPVVVTIYMPSPGVATVGVTASNVTLNSPPAPANYTKLIAVNIMISAIATTANVIANATLFYPCGIPSTKVAPYMLKNSTWIPIKPFSVKAASCAVMFAVPKDPIIGLMINYTQTPAVPTTSIPPTTSTIPQGAASSKYQSIAAVITIVAAIAAIIVLYTKMMRTRRRRPGRNRKKKRVSGRSKHPKTRSRRKPHRRKRSR
jgi:hypothetical protein